MKGRGIRESLSGNRLPVLVFVLLLAASPSLADRKLLEPVDTSSPRATLSSFLDTMNEAVASYRKDGERAPTRALAGDAVRCLDLSEVAPAIVDTVGFESALRLKEVLDRIPLPSPRHVPDAGGMEEQELQRWTVPDTPITIARVAEGPRQGEYLFSPETVARSEEFYERIWELPYRPGTGEGALYEEYQLGGGEFLTLWASGLPEWAKRSYKGQALWQWLGLVLCLTLGSALTALVYLVGHRLVGSREHLAAYVLPLSAMVMSGLVESFAREIHLTGGLLSGLSLFFTSVILVSGVRVVAVMLNQIAGLVISTAHLLPRGVDGQLVRLAFRLVIVGVTAVLLIVGADRIGLPAYSLLTGLGIGGLAVALAARETLANFLASIVIMFERPFRVGDWIKVGGQEGNVEDVGFRSTRIRTFYNSVITIPSGEMVATSIDNMGMRNYRRVRSTLQITYGTPPDRIEAFIEGIRQILREHPATRKDGSHVVLHDFGSHSLDILLYFFIVTSDWSSELAARQAILLEILRLAEQQGVEFAFPTQTLHVEGLPDG